MISFAPFWSEMMILGKKKKDVKADTGLSDATLWKIGKNQGKGSGNKGYRNSDKDFYSNLEVVDKLCTTYKLPVEKVIQFVSE